MRKESIVFQKAPYEELMKVKRRRRDRSFLRATQNRQKDQRINHAGR